jgi:hypothetical protein
VVPRSVKAEPLQLKGGWGPGCPGSLIPQLFSDSPSGTLAFMGTGQIHGVAAFRAPWRARLLAVNLVLGEEHTPAQS